jgi:hypothetical protein
VGFLVAGRVDRRTRWGKTAWETDRRFSALVAGFSALVEADRRFSALVETGFSALVETDRRFSALVGGGNAVGFAVGLLLGRRSCTVGAAGLAIARVWTVCRGGGSSIRLMKGLHGALLRWLLVWTVMLSAISSSSLSGVLSSKITNGLLLRVCR